MIVLAKEADVIMQAFVLTLKDQMSNESEKLKVTHIARALADPNNPCYGIFPRRVAGVYVKNV